MLQLLQIFFLLLLQFLGGLLQLLVQRLHHSVRRQRRELALLRADVERLLDRLLLQVSQRRSHLTQQRVEQAEKLRCRKVQLFTQVVDIFALKIKD